MPKKNQTYTRDFSRAQALPNNRLLHLLYEARWLVLLALAAYFILILATYSKVDSCWSNNTNLPKFENLGGRFGAWLADIFLYIFGFSAWWWGVWLLRTLWRGYAQLTLNPTLLPSSSFKNEMNLSYSVFSLRNILSEFKLLRFNLSKKGRFPSSEYPSPER
jgi:DNA segregation ATPase FtsK/SpoIIIE-like protein